MGRSGFRARELGFVETRWTIGWDKEGKTWEKHERGKAKRGREEPRKKTENFQFKWAL